MEQKTDSSTKVLSMTEAEYASYNAPTRVLVVLQNEEAAGFFTASFKQTLEFSGFRRFNIIDATGEDDTASVVSKRDIGGADIILEIGGFPPGKMKGIAGDKMADNVRCHF